MDNIKFNFRIKYESEKAAEEMKKALKRSLLICEIGGAGIGGAKGGIRAGREKAAEEMKKALNQLRSLSIHEVGVAGIGGAEGGIGAGGAVAPVAPVAPVAAVGAGRLDAAIESMIDRFRALFQWIE